MPISQGKSSSSHKNTIVSGQMLKYNACMSEELSKILIRVLTIPLALVVALIVLTIKKLPIKEYFALKIPSRKESVFWLLLYLPIFAIGEIYYFGTGLNEGRTWEYALPVMIVRIIGIVIFAPVCEELVFRGMLFKVISKSRMGQIGAVILTAVLFTASHFQYGFADLATIFVDALYWGWVRYKTGSTILTIAMHIFGNSIAVVEFIWLNKMIG
jgi:membrane protease YdiL (CAAX protease family)